MPRISLKETASKAGGDQLPTARDAATEEAPTRIFLYLQPKTIFYPIKDFDSDVSVEIELEHPHNVITKLSDHYTTQNLIYLDEFNVEKPTFSITIKQDDIEDVNNCFVSLTLYENISQPFWKYDEGSCKGSSGEGYYDQEESLEEMEEELIIIERRPMAQGYIDLLEFFTKTRTRSMRTVFLYPLPLSTHRMTCKMEWGIYSLHPLIKQLNFSNVLFITFASIYNLDDQLLDDCEDLMARLSLISSMPNENMEYDKIAICSFTAYSKHIIGDQILDLKWENLKNKKLENEQSMAIMTESKINKQKLFTDLLATENVDFNTDTIDPASDFALICNSMHRYILTDQMENFLEHVLAFNQYRRIIVELFREREPSVVVLQGFLDLSVFMYPQVFNCNFAIEMRPPGYKKPALGPTKEHTPKVTGKKGKHKGSASTVETIRRSAAPENQKEKIPFAIMRICLDKPITDPIQDMIDIAKSEVNYPTFVRCSRKCPLQQREEIPKLEDICEECYCGFDDTILGISDYILRNQIKSIDDDKQFYCSQLGNISNKILRLVACDFNVRIPTKTNFEFTNLMTVVYQDLLARIYDIIMKCSSKCIENCIIDDEKMQTSIITHMNIVKYLRDVGNLEMADYLMDKLQREYQGNRLLNFYLFLYNMEQQDFAKAKEYLDKPLKEKYTEAQEYVNIMILYIIYQQDLSDPQQCIYAKESLISALSKFCENNPKNISTWILLYCLYKLNNYSPGLEYCRWKYENLYKNYFFDIEFIPKSRWDIYMPSHHIDFKSQKAQHFYKVVKLFLKLALYQFAEWIYDEIADECVELERYLMQNTFKILLQKLEKKFNTKTYPVEKFLNGLYMRATLAQVNGNLEFFRSVSPGAAMKHYSLIGDVHGLDSYAPFTLGLLRYAYYLMDEKEYSKAKETFSVCCCTIEDPGICIIAAIGKGKACYRLNDLDEAEKAFAQSTQYGMYLPNVWAYLALINLKRGNNYKALECWKYARLNATENIHEEILQELCKINVDDVNLYIDKPDYKTI